MTHNRQRASLASINCFIERNFLLHFLSSLNCKANIHAYKSATLKINKIIKVVRRRRRRRKGAKAARAAIFRTQSRNFLRLLPQKLNNVAWKAELPVFMLNLPLRSLLWQLHSHFHKAEI